MFCNDGAGPGMMTPTLMRGKLCSGEEAPDGGDMDASAAFDEFIFSGGGGGAGRGRA